MKCLGVVVFVMVPMLYICGCTVSKATLTKEETKVNHILKYWHGKTVEEFVKVYTRVDSLDLGGGRVRYTIIHTPIDNSEIYKIFSTRYRYYEFYLFVSASGNIYDSSWRRMYSDDIQFYGGKNEKKKQPNWRQVYLN